MQIVFFTKGTAKAQLDQPMLAYKWWQTAYPKSKLSWVHFCAAYLSPVRPQAWSSLLCPHVETSCLGSHSWLDSRKSRNSWIKGEEGFLEKICHKAPCGSWDALFPSKKKPVCEKMPFPGKCLLYLVKVNKTPWYSASHFKLNQNYDH